MNEEIARNLYKSLERFKSHYRIEVSGAGVHWHLDIGRGERVCRIHCFNYESNPQALILGMRGNEHLSKLSSNTQRASKVGPEYFICFKSNDIEYATGRTQNSDEVEKSVFHWITDQISLLELYQNFPFVDSDYRKIQSLEGKINFLFRKSGLNLKAVIEHGLGKEFSDLWVYSSEKSCRLIVSEYGTVSVDLLLYGTSIAQINDVSDETAFSVVKIWVEKDSRLKNILEVSKLVKLSSFAADFENGDYAAWHWGNVLLQASKNELLSFYLPIIRLIANDDITSRFFSFTSLNRFVLTRCSLYPFDTKGLPILYPSDDAMGDKSFMLGIKENEPMRACGAQECFELIKNLLSQEKIKPYFGSIENSILIQVNAELQKLGSNLRAEAIQRRQWTHVLVKNNGTQICRLQDHIGKSIRVSLVDTINPNIEKRSAQGNPHKIASLIHSWLS